MAGWRSGDLMPGLGKDTLDISIGAQDFKIGTGFLVAAENQSATDVPLKDIMTSSPETIEPDDDARDALELTELRGFRHLPVFEGGHVVGIVSVRDLYSVVKRQLARAAELSEKYLFNDRYHVD